MEKVDIDWQERSRRLVGEAKLDRLIHSHVMLFGLGGVGSFAAEALARSGLGQLSLVEYDLVADTNRNRQLPALSSTIGMPKIDVVAARLLDINPAIRLHLYPLKMDKDNLDGILSGEGGIPDFIGDAIDDMSAKTNLILSAHLAQLPIISSMGAGFRLDPTQLQISDISDTHTCPLARKLRRSLREVGVEHGVPVIWSTEKPIRFPDDPAPGPSSMVFVPGTAGLLMASYIVGQL